MMIVAAACTLAALSISQASAAPFDSSSIAQSETPEPTWTCGTVDEPIIRIPQGETKEASQSRITGEMQARADINGDEELTVEDLILLLGYWGNCPVWSELNCAGDIDGNNIVDFNDLSILLGLLDMVLIPVIEIEVDPAKIEVSLGVVSHAK
jgi:hypothetical protein